MRASRSAGPPDRRVPVAGRIVTVLAVTVAVPLVAIIGACASGVRYQSGPEGGSVTIGPGFTQEEGVVNLDRTVVPAPSAPGTFSAPAPEEHVLDNGLRVWIVPGGDLPLSHIELLVPGGASVLEPTQAGLATMLADLLVEGVRLAGRELSGIEISEASERLGARMRTTASYDAVAVSIEVLSTRLADGLDLLAAVALSPTFPSDEIERVRALQMGRIVQGRDDAGRRADDVLREVLYGGADPYGRSLLGDSVTVATLDRSDLTDYHRRWFDPTSSALLVVSDSDGEAVLEMIRGRFDDWSPGDAAPLPEVADPGAAPRTVHIVDKPRAAQSEIRVGQVGVPRSSPDYYPVTVLNTLLGGAFTSRLNSVLREEKGFTYGAFSRFRMGRRAGPFEVRTAVHSPVTAEAVADILAEIDRVRREPVTDEELDRARNFAALRLPRLFESVRQRAERLEPLFLAGLEADWYDTYVESVLAVTAADVQGVARRYLDPGALQIVVVGDLATIEAPLGRLGVGETVVR